MRRYNERYDTSLGHWSDKTEKCNTRKKERKKGV